MPILKKEDDIYPENLLETEAVVEDDSRQWWSLYTRSRREKDLMRKLRAQSIAFYSPTVVKRSRSPQGRIRESYIPLFANYVFMFGTEEDRYQAMTSNCIARYDVVRQRQWLVEDLRRIQLAVQTGEPLTPEAKLEAGQRARVRSGPFRGIEGVVIRREGKTRLLMSVRYLEQGVSMQLDEGVLEPL
jgi:transcriptional antiterminator RfaH